MGHQMEHDMGKLFSPGLIETEHFDQGIYRSPNIGIPGTTCGVFLILSSVRKASGLSLRAYGSGPGRVLGIMLQV